ncbi:hypothetical protein EDC18_105104 [Natranaerovirga pectinivora]|uniref:Uncharacterized protein n=1 Tax=Natranaerovirga pectinivora TaxID=682400 RepID=A0A4V2V086_9FIRM|nr:DUF5721 family protein [Natranaerovirga pectinivora]TCT14623.1 hypothetical protein EDC18_105104 [Natranaerovirga pectinivora]
MISLKAIEIKTFMEKLFKSDAFDDFYISSVDISTFTEFKITGTLNKDYYDTNELETITHQKLIKWSSIKDIVFTIIKGNKPPSSLKIVFSFSPEKIQKFIEHHQLSLGNTQINGLFLNLKYCEGQLVCTTGTSLNVFTVDKTVDQLWDNYIKQFFKKHQLLTE